ncbi:MAG: ribonuclease Y [Chloroflexi bacterium]|nr:ribonuclease Y [Chloroflexota bacterium]
MGDVLFVLIGLLVGLAAGGAVGYYLHQVLSRKEIQARDLEAEELMNQVKTQAREIELAAKDEALKLRDEAEEEIKNRRREVQRQEQRLQAQRERLDARMDGLETRDRKIAAKEKELEVRAEKLNGMERAQLAELERISGLTVEQAKEILLDRIREEARRDAARVVREVELQAHEEADRKAREIITLAIQRTASDQVSEVTVSSVPLPNDEMKGRIIGRGGRNIRTIENITGVDLVVDDTPEAVIISSFDPVRREVARMALSKLVLDGRIHPGRIEKVVEKARQEVEAIIREEGERAAYESGVHGLHPEFIKLVGQLKFRSSYGQNCLQHSLETAYLAGTMAAELGANVTLAREAGLLHDIGKAVDHQVDGPHALIGADIAKRLNASEALANAIGAHHAEEEPQSLEAVLVQAADAISGARPGARRETLENYIRRVKTLEEIARSFAGVEEAFAIQAGREVRIIVQPDSITDAESTLLARDIAKKIEEGLDYPGQIKVTVIRETRAVDFAK